MVSAIGFVAACSRTALTVSLWRPVVLLSAHMVDALVRDEIAQVGLHELAYPKRFDDWDTLLQELI